MAAIQNNDEYIGQLLIRERVITAEELERGLKEQRNNREYLCENLVRLGFASEEKIYAILSLQIGVSFVSLKETWPEAVALNRMPGKLALAFKCLPLRLVDDVFYLAMTDPLNTKAVQEIKDYLGVEKVKIFLSGEKDLRDAIQKHYGL